MSTKWRTRRGVGLLAAGAVAVLVAAGGIAYATIPSSTGVINGCYEKRKGHLRVIDAEAGKTCMQFETPISWNVKGDTGPQGPAGPPGAGLTQIDPVSVPGDQSEVLLTAGPFTLTAVCELNVPEASTGRADQATIEVSTTQDNTAVTGNVAEIDAGQTSVLPLRTISSADGNQPRFATSSFYVLAPDGTRLSGQLAAGVNLTNQVDSCRFTGYVVTG